MSKRSEENLRGIPMKPYDLLREGFIMLGVVVALVVVLAAVFGSPDYPPVRGQDVARLQPIAYLKTSAAALAGKSSVEDYGPPYTTDTGNAQRLAGFAPANWFGVTIPINASRDFVINPLTRLAVVNSGVSAALRDYEAAPRSRQKAWSEAYLSALDRATVVNGSIRVPPGAYGPVGPMMDGMLLLGRAGLLEGALQSNPRLPYTLDDTRSLLFFQDDVDHSVAQRLDMTGGQWGISHETGPYPGAWWLWPYTFLYQIPPMSSSPNGDLEVVMIMTLVFLLLLFAPFIPVLNRLPRWLGVYRIIWRDWYRAHRPARG